MSADLTALQVKVDELEHAAFNGRRERNGLSADLEEAKLDLCRKKDELSHCSWIIERLQGDTLTVSRMITHLDSTIRIMRNDQGIISDQRTRRLEETLKEVTTAHEKAAKLEEENGKLKAKIEEMKRVLDSSRTSI